VPRPEDEPLNDFQKGVLALVAGVEATNHIDSHRAVHEKIADVVKLVDSEARIPQLKTIGQAWKYMKEKLDLTFQYEGVSDEKK
jgi:predicted glycoside hydrolase/deacetylase ChbG (UPF0249 family)